MSEPKKSKVIPWLPHTPNKGHLVSLLSLQAWEQRRWLCLLCFYWSRNPLGIAYSIAMLGGYWIQKACWSSQRTSPSVAFNPRLTLRLRLNLWMVQLVWPCLWSESPCLQRVNLIFSEEREQGEMNLRLGETLYFSIPSTDWWLLRPNPPVWW